MDHKVTTDYTRLLHNSNVKVYVRARPCADGNDAPEDMFERKREAPKNIVIKDTERMQYGNHAFSFDNIYWTDTTQSTLFETTSKALVDYALKGINSCCFAYGQTGSGKTFSFGSNAAAAAKADDEYDYEKANFEIHEDAQGRVFVKDLSMVTVVSREEVDALVQSGLKLRATHETKMNAVSSRSHTVFTIHVFQQIHETDEIIYGQLNMVDLAGSERLKKSESDGQRLKEALHINSSLSAVGKVVMSLDPESGYNYIPYRDSKLTRLLQNSIGGNSFTILIATIHPMKEHYEECLSTLQFANRCRSVQNQPRVNHINGSVADKDRRIRKLQEELTLLRRQLEGLRAEYNHRFVRALNQLGFDAEEITENGEIKFADGMVLQSVFSDQQDDDKSRRDGAPLSPLARHTGAHSHATSHGLRRANELSRKDRDHLREKYANAKTNFSVVVTEAKKEKEESRKTINDLKRRIIALEDTVAQKAREYERSLAAEAVRHRAEIQQLLLNNTLHHQQQQHGAGSASTRPASASTEAVRPARRDEQVEQRLAQRVVAVELSKNEQIALIRQQYEQIIKQKKDEVAGLSATIERLQGAMVRTAETFRGDCAELYAYIARLHHALESSQRFVRASIRQRVSDLRGQVVSAPKNILADPSKLRYVKALLATDSTRHLEFQLEGAGISGSSAALKPMSTAQRDWAEPPPIDGARSSIASLTRPVSAPVRRCKPTTYPSIASLTRPVSAPVRRCKPTTYPSALRDKVKDNKSRRGSDEIRR
ncbi:hypothetical protein P43SY_004930 [Pythium insidiosum]|uniref:Kinesin-like protein n=1 Tax=Pythium insidiosum TaxID=114742 RepID=A0AAD5Q700_PYTIN|nr:hypothetical protein P43SY_004930 [Pythium insidiosum]